MTEKTNNEKHWPYSSLLFFGYFGKNSPGGKRLFWRTWISILVFFVGMFMIEVLDQSSHIMLQIAAVSFIPTAIFIVMWAYREYLNELDELSQMIQYKAFAFSYGLAMAIAVTLYATNFQFGIYLPALWVIFAEILRGVALTRIAKSYA